MWFRQSFVWFVTALAMIGCRPADQSVKSVKELLEAGELVEFAKPDYRRPSCPPTRSDWTELQIDDEGRRQIVLGYQRSVLSPGRNSCIRVGSTVDLRSPQAKSGGGRIVISKLGLIKIDKLDKRHLSGRYYASDSSFQRAKALVAARLQPFHDGLVMITSFEYVPGSAADEDALRKRDLEEKSGDGLVETRTDGETLTPNCKAVWNKVIMPQEFQAAVETQDLRSWYTLGDYNCLAQGATAGVSSTRDGPSSLQVKILKLRKFRASALTKTLDPKYFSMTEDVYARVYARIQQDLSMRPEEWITVADFLRTSAPVDQPGFEKGGSQ